MLANRNYKNRQVAIIVTLLVLILGVCIVAYLNLSYRPATINKGGASLERVFSEHRNAIWKVQFSPDGNSVASCSIDSTVIIRDRETGKIKQVLQHPAGVTNMDYSKDGQFIVTSAYDAIVRLWSLVDLKVIQVYKGHEGTIWSVSISPDGKQVASAGQDQQIRLWNRETAELIRAIPAHKLNIWSVAFSPDGNTLASGSFDNEVKCWSVKTGTLLHTLKGHKQAVITVDYSPDGQLLASASDDATIKLWNVKEGTLVRTLKGGKEHFYSLAFSPDSKWIVGGSRDKSAMGEVIQHILGESQRHKGITMRLWEVRTGSLVQTFSQHSNDVNGVAYSPDGKWIAGGSVDNTVSLWRMNN